MDDEIYELAFDNWEMELHEGPIWEPKVVYDPRLPFRRFFMGRGPFGRGQWETVGGYMEGSDGSVVYMLDTMS